MSDFEKEKFYPSTESLIRLRNTAIFYLAGGVVLAALRLLAGKLVFTLAGGGIIGAVGVGWLMANNPNNKKTGMMITGLGILIMLSGFRFSILPVITGTALSIITIGFFVLGAKNFIMYIIAQGKRG